MKLKEIIKKLLILFLSDHEESEIVFYDDKIKHEYKVRDIFLMPNKNDKEDIVVRIKKKEEEPSDK